MQKCPTCHQNMTTQWSGQRRALRSQPSTVADEMINNRARNALRTGERKGTSSARCLSTTPCPGDFSRTTSAPSENPSCTTEGLEGAPGHAERSFPGRFLEEHLVGFAKLLCDEIKAGGLGRSFQ
jgi:hypothetical protein